MTLFSEEHIEQQKNIHEDCPSYGETSLVFAPMVSELANTNHVKTFLDYGAGNGQLSKTLEFEGDVDIRLYDPAFSEISSAPEPADMVVCIDVLDNIEPSCIEAILDDLARVTARVGFFAVNTETSDKQELNVDASQSLFPAEWWLPKLMDRFELHYFSRINFGFVVVVKAKSSH